MQYIIKDEFFHSVITELEDNNGWKFEQDDTVNGLIYYSKPKLKCIGNIQTSINALRVSGTLNYKPEIVFRTLHNTDLRGLWMRNTAEVKQIIEYKGDYLKGGEDIIYSRGTSPGFMISPRDFCLVRRWNFREGGYDWVIQSINHKDCPEKQGIIRARAIVQAIQMKPFENDKTRITLVTQVDPCGWVPSFAVNYLSHKLPKDFIISLGYGCEVFIQKYMKS